MSKYNFSIVIIAIMGIITACGSNHSSETDSKEAETAAKESMDVTLTAEQIKTIGVTIGGLEQRELSSVVKANGMVGVLNQHKALVTSQFGGTAKSIQVHSGTFIKEGTVIATISNPDFIAVQEEYLTVKAQLNAGSIEATASLAAPQYAALQEQYTAILPQIELAELEWTRQQQLLTGNAGSAKNFQQAEADLVTLKAKRDILQKQMALFSKNTDTLLKTRLAALENKLKMMGINTNSLSPETMQTTISVRSPLSGRVGEITAKIGEYISENNPIAEIIDLTNLQLSLNVYESDLNKFHDGQVIRFNLTNNPSQEYAARVHTLGGMVNATSKTAEVHAHIEGDKTGLIEGMNATATVNVGKAKVLVAPNTAIVTESGKDFIFVIKATSDKETIFEKTAVNKGTIDGKFTEIRPLKPLAEDAKIANTQAFFILGKMTNMEE